MSIKKIGYFVAIGLFLFGCTMASSRNGDDFNVTVSAYGGNVEILRGDDILTIHLAMRLELNDIVKVPSDGYVQLLFKEGAVVTGMADSALQIPQEGIVRLIQGESFYHIEKQQARSFVVQTDQARIAVFGTQFMVEANSDETHIALLNGTISIESQEEVLTLEAGQEVSISKEEADIFILVEPMKEQTLMRFNAIYHLPFYYDLDDAVDTVSDTNEETQDQERADLIKQITELQRQLSLLRTNMSSLEEEVGRLGNVARSYENLYRVEREWAERYKRLLEQNGVAFEEE